MARDRLLELQERSGAAPAPSPQPPEPAEPAGTVTVSRPSRLGRLLARRPAGALAQPAQQPAADRLLAELGELQRRLGEARADVEEVSRQQCRQLNSPRHQQQAWEATQRRAGDALGRLGRLKSELDSLQKSKDAAPGLTRTQAHMVQIQINSFRTQLLSVVQRFNEEEMNFRQRKKDHLKRQLQITGSSLNDDELENLLDQGDTQVFNESILARVDSARAELNEAEDRYKQIRELETNIEQLHQMFLQLSLLVQQQGEVIDRIEEHTVKSAMDAEKGQKELQGALRKKKQGRAMKIGCGVVGVVVLVVLLIVLISYLG